MKKLLAGLAVLCFLLIGAALAEGWTPTAAIAPSAPTNTDVITLRLDRQYDRVSVQFYENGKNSVTWTFTNMQESELRRLSCGECRLLITCELNGTTFAPITVDFTVTPAIPTEDAERFTYRVADDQAVITGYTGNKLAVIIPSQIGGYPVTEIGARAFQGKEFITVKISEGIRVIDTEAFSIYNLQNVELPQSLREIRRGAFRGCGNLSAIDIPQGVTVLGSQAFASCSSLSSVRVPAGVTAIEYQTFYGCSALQDVSLPDSLRRIGDEAFRYCGSLQRVDLPAGLTAIGVEAFPQTTEMHLTDGNAAFRVENGALISLVEGAVVHCNPVPVLTIPLDVTRIGDGVVSGRNDIGSLTLPKGLKTIGDSCFYNCSGLTELVIPEGMESLGASFQSCGRLQNVSLPSTLTYIDPDAFRGCPNAVFTVNAVPGYDAACVNAFLQGRSQAPVMRTMRITAETPTVQVGEEARWTISVIARPSDTFSISARVQNPAAGYYGEWRDMSELTEYPAVIAETVTYSGEYSLDIEVYDIDFDEYEDDGLVTVLGDSLPPFTVMVECDREIAHGEDAVTWTITPVGGTPDYEIHAEIYGGGPYEVNPFGETVLYSKGEPVQYTQQLLFGNAGYGTTYMLNVRVYDSAGRVCDLGEEAYEVAVTYQDPVYGFPYASIQTEGEMCLDGEIRHMLTPEGGVGPYTDFTVSLFLEEDESLVDQFVIPVVAEGETVTVKTSFSSEKYRHEVYYHIRESFTDTLGYRWTYDPSGSAHHTVWPFGTIKTHIVPAALEAAVNDTLQWTVSCGREYYNSESAYMNYESMLRKGSELLITPCVRDALGTVRKLGEPVYYETWGAPVTFAWKAEEIGTYFLQVQVRDDIRQDGAAFEGGEIAVSAPNTLTLPFGTKQIGAEAFIGVSAVEAHIPVGCESIGEGAFAQSAVKIAYIPATVAAIGENAFPIGTTIITPAGSPAAAWGRANGCSVIEK